MGQFTAFSLTDGIKARQAGQQMRSNRLRMNALQASEERKQTVFDQSQDRDRNLQQIAQESMRTTYNKEDYDLAGPNKPTGEKYDPEMNEAGMREAGYTKEANALERHLSQMAPEERKQIEFDAEQGGVDAFNADTEEKWEILQNKLEIEAEIAGKEFNPRTWGERQDVINEARDIKDLTGDNKSGGNSEFEREIDSLLERKIITKEEHGQMTEQRAKVLSGEIGRAATEGTQSRHEDNLKLGRDKFGFSVNKEQRRATKERRTEWTSDAKALRSMDSEISRILAAAKDGGPLASKTIQSALSRMSNSKVRALAELEQYKNYGTLPERISNTVSKFINGQFSEVSLQEAVDFATAMRENYVDPGMKEVSNYWREQAANEGLNPHSVARYSGRNQVRKDYKKGWLTEKQAGRILDDNPQWARAK